LAGGKRAEAGALFRGTSQAGVLGAWVELGGCGRRVLKGRVLERLKDMSCCLKEPR
jgi:hypothetical protein